MFGALCVEGRSWEVGAWITDSWEDMVTGVEVVVEVAELKEISGLTGLTTGRGGGGRAALKSGRSLLALTEAACMNLLALFWIPGEALGLMLRFTPVGVPRWRDVWAAGG